MRKIITICSILVMMAMATTAQAMITGVAGTTAAPGPTLGPYTMTPFGDDTRPIYQMVSSVPSPCPGVSIGFSPSLEHRETPYGGWATWSHGYSGDVYWTGYGGLSVTISLPDDVKAFYFYAEPNPFSVRRITATTLTGVQYTILSQDIHGYAGAEYFGFWTDCTDFLSTITVDSIPYDGTPASDFAIGEFGIYCGACIPAPGAILLGSIGVGIVGWLRRRRTL